MAEAGHGIYERPLTESRQGYTKCVTNPKGFEGTLYIYTVTTFLWRLFATCFSASEKCAFYAFQFFKVCLWLEFASFNNEGYYLWKQGFIWWGEKTPPQKSTHTPSSPQKNFSAYSFPLTIIFLDETLSSYWKTISWELGKAPNGNYPIVSVSHMVVSG